MNPPSTTFLLSNKWDMGPTEGLHRQRVSDEMVDGLMKGGPEKDIMAGFMVSQRSCPDLLQNCDLPPPTKVFAEESDMVARPPSMRQPSPFIKANEMEEQFTQGGYSSDRLGLLRALRLSQTRAREAEKKAAEISMEKDRLATFFLEESSRLFAHRQWLKLLEIELKQLHSQLPVSQGAHSDRQPQGKKDKIADAGSTWRAALALCFGIASVGFALGYRYLF